MCGLWVAGDGFGHPKQALYCLECISILLVWVLWDRALLRIPVCTPCKLLGAQVSASHSVFPSGFSLHHLVRTFTTKGNSSCWQKSLKFSGFWFFIFVYWTCVNCATLLWVQHMKISKDNSRELILSYHNLGPMDWMKVFQARRQVPLPNKPSHHNDSPSPHNLLFEKWSPVPSSDLNYI